jgi:transaldolase
VTSSRLHQISALGQSVWIDFLSRQLLEEGELDRLIREDAISGVTSNPTIFQKAIAGGTAYDEQLREVLEHEEDGKEVFLALASRDVANACDVLRDTWERTDGVDGRVSLEVDPDLAYDTDATIAEARRLSSMVDRPNLYVKIPATQPGLAAIEASIAAGIPINVTLIFSLQRYREVAEAYIAGLEKLVAGGGDASVVPSVASFFVSRVDTEADKRLDAAGGHDDLKGKLAVANAKLAYEAYKEIFSGDRWEALAAQGARPQRCLWASTSTKNPAYPDTLYVDELIGPDTVNTMPPETIEAFQDHGTVEVTIDKDLDEAHRIFERFEEAGIDYDDIVRVLEEEGVQKFSDSFKELLSDVKEKRDAMAHA